MQPFPGPQARYASAALQDVVFVVIGLVVVVFVFVLGSIGSGKSRDESHDDELGRLAAELEEERRRNGELEAELDRLRAERT